MEVLYILIPLSFFMSFCGLLAFFWASSIGQFDDLSRGGEEMLNEVDEI